MCDIERAKKSYQSYKNELPSHGNDISGCACDSLSTLKSKEKREVMTKYGTCSCIDHIKISAIRIASAKKEISKDYGKDTFEHISEQNYKSCLSSHNSECVCCSGVFTSDISDVNALHFPV